MADIRELSKRATEAFNAHDSKAIEALVHDDVTVTAPGGMVERGKAAATAFNENWWTAFPDARTEVRTLRVDGNTAVIEGTFTGTHTGVFHTPMGDIPPTGKSVHGEFVSIDTLRDDKFSAQRLYFDRMELMEQLGLVPSGAAAG